MCLIIEFFGGLVGNSIKNAGKRRQNFHTKPRNNDPPPVIATPKSAISADNSGGALTRCALYQRFLQPFVKAQMQFVIL